jgi:alpha-D-ribose 1-methylphosphonate 5-phosphate C-P lyase
MIKDDNEFLTKAMKAYDNRSAITIDEFNQDLGNAVSIRKFIKRYLTEPDSVNVRKMVNYVVVFYNCFGSVSAQLLLYKINEPEHLGVLVPIVSMIGWDISEYPECPINSSIVHDLIHL